MIVNFSIKESLNSLKNKNLDSNLNRGIESFRRFEDYQLEMMASTTGIKLTNIILLQFNEKTGFQCFNIQEDIYGRLPICKNIEKFLNEEYTKSFADSESIAEFIKSELVRINDNESWEDFVDNQEMCDCQVIVSDIERIAKENNLPVEHQFGEIGIDEPYYNTMEDEELDRFTHHWVTINDKIYEFSKGTIKDFINWSDLYDVDPELVEYYSLGRFK